jgi:hypothetical protein
MGRILFVGRCAAVFATIDNRFPPTHSGLVVLSAAAGASAFESVAVFDADFGRAAFWFLRTTAPLALPLGIGIGAVLGAGMGLSQPAARPEA